MKKITLILLLFTLNYMVWGQCPLNDNLYFNNQQAIDNFLATYDGCGGDTLKGNLKLGVYNGSDISDLNGLDFIKVITGELSIEGTQLPNLNGLEGLTTIGGDFYLGEDGYFCAIFDNPLLTNIEALNNLTHIGGSFIIRGNDNLTSLNGLQQLTSIGERLDIIAANGLTDLSGLDNLNSVGDLNIGGLLYYEDFFQFCYVGNDALTSLNGLQNLTNITSSIAISYNQNLTTCDAPGICNLIDNVTNVFVSDNASGCNTTAEILNSCISTPTCTEQDSLALVALHNATNGANWTNTWNLNTPIGTWHGVTMSADGCNVLELNLSNNNLVGIIPAEIGELSTLTRLILHTNSLSGNIPTTIGDLSELRQIWLFSNQLSGTLPSEIENLNQLTHLGLGGNQLTGTIPASYGNLSNLGFFTLKNNQLSGCFDINLLNICVAGNDARINAGNNFDTAWSVFCTTGNGGCAPPPSSCRYLDSLVLVTLHQSTNGANWNTTWNLNQPMTTWHGITLNTDGCVAEINLNSNNLTGIIPAEIGELAALTRLNMHSNSLSGSLPATIGDLSELRQIWLFNNQLSGTLPSEIGNLTHLSHFGIGANQLTGTIPASYGNLSNLVLFTLPQNQLSGCFDDNLANICNAATNSNINSGNNFDALWSDFCANGAGNCSTPPPVTCSTNDSLALVVLYNSTNGANWTTTWNLNQPMSTWYGVTLNTDGCVQELNLPNNNLNGTIPTAISSLANLERLNLHTNNLSGSIPSTIGDLSALRQIWLFSNQLSGTLPSEIGNLTNLTHLGIGGNQLTGSIPASYGNLSNLGFLALKNNNLSGCYDANLANICAAGNDSRVSSGNNFAASWASFCTSATGCCNCRLDMSDNLMETEELLINLYPNPTNQFINIDIQAKNNDRFNYMIYNALGEMVQSGQIRSQQGKHQYSVELNNLNTGVYYFNLMIEDKQTTKHFTVIR